jgi:hemolysin activation/secretion protein
MIHRVKLLQLTALFLLTFVLRAAETPPIPVHVIHQIAVSDTMEAAQQLAFSPDGGFLVIAHPWAELEPHRQELIKRLAAAENRPIDEPVLAAIAQVIETFARQHDYPAAVAVIPPQNVAGGIVRVALLRGKIRSVKIEGNQWFSESLLREKLRLELGQVVRGSVVEPALNWTNNNPFRRVRLNIQPVATTGDVDVTIGVQDRAPIRLAATYDNTGNDVIGENHYGAALTYGNLWGRDHQLTYQFLTTDDVSLFKAHGLDYRAPLPWRHLIVVGGSYVQVNPTLFQGFFIQRGKSVTADAKYVAPVNLGKWQMELSGGIAFKQTNNNLEFGGEPVLGDTTDIFTGTLTAAGMHDDARGRWIATAVLTASPGGLNSRNDRQSYDESRIGANPRFVYGQLGLQRLTRLTANLTSTLRGTVQFASTNLLAQEQFSIGGMATVRGYKERILSGDNGYMFTHELQQRLPSILLPRKLPAVDLAGVFFWDFGRIYRKFPLPVERETDYLASVGLGVRLSFANNFSATIDYGYQLEEVELPGEPHDRVHVKVTLGY